MKLTVLVLQEVVPHYRIPFFRFLSEELNCRNIELCVLSSSDLPKTDDLGFRHKHVLPFRGGLPLLEAIYCDPPTALVLPHDARFAPIAVATRLRQNRGRKQLLWGMGLARRYGVGPSCDSLRMDVAEYRALPSPRVHHLAGEAVRRLMLSTCDHYLSYTQISTTNLLDNGYDPARITTLNNAVEALATLNQVTKAQRTPLQILFVASLLDDKGPLAAVAIVDRIRSIASDATLHIVGDGPLRQKCEQAANVREWVHYHGPQRGQALRELALTSDIAMIPGRVGLAVLEMASAGLPMVTLAVSSHGAEIAYLKHGANGLLLGSDLNSAARELGRWLRDRVAIERMRSRALSTANKYTVRHMVANFADGLTTSLAAS
jgi:glycosyltransferase involved in cell wall biosynthesis